MVRPAPHGVPQIEATFDKNANEILNVSAQDKSTVRSNQITITTEKGRLSPAETDHVVQEAREYRDEDEVNKTKIEAQNGLENHGVTTRNTIIEGRPKDKFEVGHKKKTEEAVQNARNCSDKNQSGGKHEFEAKQKEVKGADLTIQ